MPSCDAIVIGGGTNGLACAFALAQTGRRVTVVESGALGGGAVTCEFAPGYKVSGLAHVVTHLDARVVAGMGLSVRLSQALPTVALAQDGGHLTIEGGHVAGADAAAWAALHAQLLAFAQALAPLRGMTPPRLGRGLGNEVLRLGRVAFGLRAMGQAQFRDFLRMMLINVADVLEDELTDARLKGAVAFDAVLGAWLGPRSPNSLMLLLNRMAGDAPRVPFGGMGAVAEAMAAACVAKGVVMRAGVPVTGVMVEDDRAVGVMLATGEDVRAGLVVSAVNPRTTFQTLVGARHLDAGFLRRTDDIRSRGGAAKLHLALSGRPDFKGADLRARLVIAPSVGAVEGAFNPVKYGQVPDKPVMEIILPSAHEGGMAPDGHHVLSAIVQFAPHDPADRDAARAQMLAHTMAVLEDYAPGIGGMVTHAELLMPYDIAARFGMVGGNWHHGELSVEQMLFLRPMADVAQYATPLPGLWLAGAGSHPGGNISGAAGWNAAAAIGKAGA
jgi:phytoene dehydrogenase-like protein